MARSTRDRAAIVLLAGMAALMCGCEFHKVADAAASLPDDGNREEWPRHDPDGGRSRSPGHPAAIDRAGGREFGFIWAVDTSGTVSRPVAVGGVPYSACTTSPLGSIWCLR